MRDPVTDRDWLTVFQLPWSRPGSGGSSTGLLEGFLAKTRLDLTPLQ